MRTNEKPQRRHAAAQARMATAVLSIGGFAGIIGAMALNRAPSATTSASTGTPAVAPSTATTPADDTPVYTPATVAPTPVAPTPVVRAPVVPAPVPTVAPATNSGASSYAGTPARTTLPPVTRSRASR